MTSMFRRPAMAALALAAAVVAPAACSSGSSSKPAAASSTTLTGGSTGSSSTTAGSATALGCRSTTSGTGGAGGGDVLVPGDIPDTQHFVTYHSSDGYHVDYPEGWAQTMSGTTVTFTDKFNSVRAEVTNAATAPSVASAQTNDVAALAASVPCFHAGKVSSVARKAGSAILITYQADSPPDPVTNKVVTRDVERYQFWQSGKQVTLTLSSPKGSDNVDPWRKVTDSFAWGA
jgi:hypothetical protein